MARKGQEREEIEAIKKDEDTVPEEAGEDGRIQHNQSYSIEAWHVTKLNVVPGKEIQCVKIQLWADDGTAVSDGNKMTEEGKEPYPRRMTMENV